ncbi:hypothetical protein, partial [Streptococcus sobrinus]|uniref:hypothetical protein n=1 Tax=Streptococcus sobrinus TaxID=1310 RepID=UPI001C3FB288
SWGIFLLHFLEFLSKFPRFTFEANCLESRKSFNSLVGTYLFFGLISMNSIEIPNKKSNKNLW